MSTPVCLKFDLPLTEGERDDLMRLLWARGVTEFELTDDDGETCLRLNPRQARGLDESLMALLRSRAA
ncbi:MAG: hypothetical protein ACXVVQ_17180 [Solirubrobacteraceae bacterium]